MINEFLFLLIKNDLVRPIYGRLIEIVGQKRLEFCRSLTSGDLINMLVEQE